jgi:hypothetical protein
MLHFINTVVMVYSQIINYQDPTDTELYYICCFSMGDIICWPTGNFSELSRIKSFYLITISKYRFQAWMQLICIQLFFWSNVFTKTLLYFKIFWFDILSYYFVNEWFTVWFIGWVLLISLFYFLEKNN